MNTQARRLALATAFLWLGLGGGVEAGPVLLTPAGLSPGDHFRFVFNTAGGGPLQPTSSDIAVYDSLVNTQAGGATYNGALVSWLVIGSTATVNAIDHVGQTPDPVYLPDGTLVTTSTTSSGLWSGSILHGIDEVVTGAPGAGIAWTGTDPTGLATASPLGHLTSITIGTPARTDASWVDIATRDASFSFSYYGISQDLVAPGSAVPEPASLWMLGTAISAGLAYGWSRHRRQQRS